MAKAKPKEDLIRNVLVGVANCPDLSLAVMNKIAGNDLDWLKTPKMFDALSQAFARAGIIKTSANGVCYNGQTYLLADEEGSELIEWPVEEVSKSVSDFRDVGRYEIVFRDENITCLAVFKNNRARHVDFYEADFLLNSEEYDVYPVSAGILVKDGRDLKLKELSDRKAFSVASDGGVGGEHMDLVLGNTRLFQLTLPGFKRNSCSADAELGNGLVDMLEQLK